MKQPNDIAEKLINAKSAMEIMEITQSLYVSGEANATVMAILDAMKGVGHHPYIGEDAGGEIFIAELLASGLKLLFDPSLLPDDPITRGLMIARNISISQLSSSDFQEIVSEFQKMIQDDDVAFTPIFDLMVFILLKRDDNDIFAQVQAIVHEYFKKLSKSIDANTLIIEAADKYERMFVTLASGMVLNSKDPATKQFAKQLKEWREKSGTELKEIRKGGQYHYKDLYEELSADF